MASSHDYAEKAANCEAIVITPTILSTMDSPTHYPGVKEIWMGGEPPSANLIKLWSSPTCKVYNCYGPTECTTAISSVEMFPNSPIILGGLIPGIEIILLDENLKEVEVEVGEICIRGPCLAAGYLNNEELTRQRFITWEGRRHYRSGDLAKRVPGGFAFVGRIDLQVKNRGFLINLETEVVPALLSYPATRSAAAIMHDSRLVGFVTPATIPPLLLRMELIQKFDSFVVPDVVIPLERLPVTSNQKVDTAALRKIMIQETTSYEGLSDQSSPSEIVRNGFSNILETPISQINDDSSFWELGGNSLSAVRLSSFLRAHGLKISIGEFFGLDKVSSICQKAIPIQTPEQLFETPTNGSKADARTMRILPMAEIQSQFISETLQCPAKNNLVFSLEMDNTSGNLSDQILHDAWETLFERHSILRTTFDLSERTQLIHPKPNLDWTAIQVPASEYDSTRETIQQSIWNQIYGPIRMPWEPINCLKMIESPKKSIAIFWLIHHSLFDGWSLGIILRELEDILQNRILPAPPQFSDAVFYQKHVETESRFENDSFWKKSLTAAQDLKPINLPKPAFSPSPKSSQDWLVESLVVATTKSELDILARGQRVSSSSLLHAAWSLVLSKYTSSKTICYNSSFSGRSLPLASAESIVGPLNQRCPMITTIDKTMKLDQFFREIHREVYEVRDFQWSSYGHLEELIGPEAYDLLVTSCIMIFWEMPVDSTRWKLRDEQKPTKPLELRIEQDGEVIHLHLRYDYKIFDARAIRHMVTDLADVLAAFLSLPAHTLVESVFTSLE